MRSIASALRDAWRLAYPYFGPRSDERWVGRGVLLGIIALILVDVQIDVILNHWRGDWYDALQNYDLPTFIALTFWWHTDPKTGFMPGFVPLVAIAAPEVVFRVYLEQFLSIRWRRWMTNQTVGTWLSGRAYYTISLTRRVGDTATDNPDQRISEDVRDFTQSSVSLFFQIFRRVLLVVNFAIILWDLSGPLTIWGITIPGYMFWGAVIYALAGSWLTNIVGRPLVGLNYLQQKAEADFRYALVRLRENAEGVALSSGEADEREQLRGRFAEVAHNWFRIMYRTVKVNLLTQVYFQAAVLFPILLAAPAYFAKRVALGGLMRVVGAFSQVQDSLSWFINAYQDIATWRATVNRLSTFHASVQVAQGMIDQGPALVPGDNGVSLEAADIRLPDGTTVLANPPLSFRRGDRVTISGNSGAGKSTLFRSVAGIWPFGGGRITREQGSYLFLPQRPYIPLGTLRHAIAYPTAASAHSDAAVKEALHAVGLGNLEARLDEDQPWAQILSGGEQQRLAVARALLLKPDFLFLDEATSALDPEAEEALYQALNERLPGAAIISIAHRAAVARFHAARVQLQRRPGETGQLVTLPQPSMVASTAAP